MTKEDDLQKAFDAIANMTETHLYKASLFYGEGVVTDVIDNGTPEDIMNMLELKLRDWKGLKFVQLDWKGKRILGYKDNEKTAYEIGKEKGFPDPVFNPVKKWLEDLKEDEK